MEALIAVTCYKSGIPLGYVTDIEHQLEKPLSTKLSDIADESIQERYAKNSQLIQQSKETWK